MSQYFDLSIRRIEIKKPKRDLKPVIKLQDEVNKTLLHDEYYYPTDERTIQERSEMGDKVKGTGLGLPIVKIPFTFCVDISLSSNPSVDLTEL